MTLKTNVDKVPHEKLVQASSTALCILYHTATRTNFFGTHYERQEMSDKNIALSMSQNPDITFVGGLLFKLALIVQFNGFTVIRIYYLFSEKNELSPMISNTFVILHVHSGMKLYQETQESINGVF